MTGNREGELHAGPFSLLFEESFLTSLSSELSRNPFHPHIVLVGSNLLGIHLRHALAQKMEGHANVRFPTFLDLSETLTRESYVETGRRDFPADAEELWIGGLCRNLGRDSLFADVREQGGFHRALGSTFHDLIDAGITSLPKSSGKLRELARLFSEHRKRTADRFATTADRILEASGFADRFPAVFQTDVLFCYGFYDLTGIQKKLLQSLARHVALLVWMPVPAAEPARTARGFFETLLGKAEEIPAAPSPKFTALSAPDIFSEAEEVVRWILTLQQKEKIPLHRFGILLRNPDDYLCAFTEALERAGVPFYREGGRPLRETRIGEAVVRMLDLLGGEWNRTNVIRLLSVFPFKASQEMGAPADWDRWSREAFVAVGREQFLSRLSGLQRRLEVRKDPSSAPLQRFIPFLRGWFEGLRQIETAATAWVSFGSSVSRWLLTHAEEDEALAAAVETCRSLADLEEIEATPAALRTVLKNRLSNAHLRGEVFERDGVYLGSLEKARAISFACVAIPGLAERSFPAPPRPDPVLLDFERKNLNRALGSELPLKETRLSEEFLLFELALSQAGKALLLSHPRTSSSDERERLPSSFLLRIAERHRLEITRRPHLRWEREPPEAWIDGRDWLSTRIGARVVRDRSRAWNDLVPWNPLAASVRNWVNERLGSPFFGPYDGVVSPAGPPGKDLFSASELSTYATCPYRFFLRHRMKLQPVVRPDEVRQLRPVDRGEIIHEILFRLFTELRKEGFLPLRPEIRAEIERKLLATSEEVFSEVQGRLPLGPALLWETERAFLLSDLRALLDLEIRETANFLPEAFEVRFGMEKTPKEDERLSTERPVEIPLGRDRIRLRGKIDRIDLSPDGRRARVIDYKSGSLKDQKEERFEGGQAVQLPVYLSALPLLLPEVDLAQSEAILLSTSYGSGFRRIRFSGATLIARKNDFSKILTTVLKGAASGLFPPRPGPNLENCQFCDYPPICGKAVLRVFERKEADPAVSPVLDLKEIE